MTLGFRPLGGSGTVPPGSRTSGDPRRPIGASPAEVLVSGARAGPAGGC